MSWIDDFSVDHLAGYSDYYGPSTGIGVVAGGVLTITGTALIIYNPAVLTPAGGMVSVKVDHADSAVLVGFAVGDLTHGGPSDGFVVCEYLGGPNPDQTLYAYGQDPSSTAAFAAVGLPNPGEPIWLSLVLILGTPDHMQAGAWSHPPVVGGTPDLAVVESDLSDSTSRQQGMCPILGANAGVFDDWRFLGGGAGGVPGGPAVPGDTSAGSAPLGLVRH